MNIIEAMTELRDGKAIRLDNVVVKILENGYIGIYSIDEILLNTVPYNCEVIGVEDSLRTDFEIFNFYDSDKIYLGDIIYNVETGNECKLITLDFEPVPRQFLLLDVQTNNIIHACNVEEDADYVRLSILNYNKELYTKGEK